MTYLIAGLFLFLGAHSVRIVATDWRARVIAQRGEAFYKGGYTLVSLAGFALLVYGFGVARETPVQLWLPPLGLRHAASLLTLLAFVLLVAAYVPGNAIKARLQHPMVLGVKTWALAHLLATGRLETLVLFGAFLLWAVLDFRSARRRPGAAPPAASGPGPTLATVLIGVGAWALFAWVLHGWLIGIRPFG